METNKAAAAVQDSDGASDCSRFSIITPPSPPSMSSCSKCSSQEKVPDKDSDDAPVTNEHERTKGKKRLATKSKKHGVEAPEPWIDPLTEKSENLSTRLADVEFALEWFKSDVAFKFANYNNSIPRDTLRAGDPDLEIEFQRETMVAILKNQYQHLWEEVARLLRQAMFENEFSFPPATRQILPLADQNWCLEIVKNAFITSIIDGTKRDAAASMLATPTLASEGVTEPPPSDEKKKKRKGYKGWQPEPCLDPFSPPHPEVYGMPPTEQYPGPPDPYAQRQPMPYPPPPNPEAYGMPPSRQYPDPADPFAHMRPMPYTPPVPYTPPMPYSPPPPPPRNPEEVHIMEDFPRPHDPFAVVPPLPFSRRRSVDSRSSSSMDWRREYPKLKPKPGSRLRINKFEVRWWLRTALSAFEILCMIAVIVAVFRAPGLLGELVDVMNPRNRDRCLGFRVRR